MHLRSRWLLGLILAVACALAACTSTATAPQTQTSTSPTATPAQVTATVGGLAADSATGTASAPSSFTKIGTYDATGVTHADPSFAALAGATAESGQLGTAVYQIEVPSNWNHELVLFAHGFAGFGTQVSVSPPPAALRKELISEGFAWAASSYSQNGYDPAVGADDTLALKLHFAKEHGTPTRTYLVGLSMGGNVATLSLEHFGDQYDGAVAACGAVAGEDQIDYLISWGEVAAYIAGVKLPIGQGTAAMGAVFQQINTALGPADNPTQKGLAFQDVMMNLTGGPRPFFQQGIEQQYIVNFGLLLLDPNRQSLPGKAATNVGVVYHIDPGFGITDAELNAGVERLTADASARAKADAAPTTGKITKPLLTIHGTGDLFVPISMEQDYAQKVAAAGDSNLLVQRAIRSAGHCNFSDSEITTAWNDLVDWVEHGVKPKGDDLSGDLSDIGTQFTDPLRSGDPGTISVAP
jgi:pimeloyl-ACP methyl ester carboxylesterase